MAVCSEADCDAVHIRAADEHVFIGPAPATKSYLNVDALIGAVDCLVPTPFIPVTGSFPKMRNLPIG